MVTARLWLLDLGLAIATATVGLAGVWLMRRYTLLSARNLYLPAAAGLLGVVGCAVLGWRLGELVMLPLAAPWMTAASAGHRWRQSDLGAGEELRAHELARRWVWQPQQALAA